MKQKAEGRRQKAEGRKQKAESRKQNRASLSSAFSSSDLIAAFLRALHYFSLPAPTDSVKQIVHIKCLE